MQVEKSADFLRSINIPYEFRTTVVRELHKTDDFHNIGQRFIGARKYFLQTFKNNEDVLVRGLSSYSKEKMEDFCDILKSYNIDAEIRE